MIREGWDSSDNKEDLWENLIEKTKSCKKKLQTWHKNTFKRADEEIFKLKKCFD